MVKEKWIRWEPVFGLHAKYDIDAVLDTMEGFDVILTEIRGKGKSIKLRFYDFIHAYKFVDETYWIKPLHEIDNKYGTDFYGDWTFFKVENSLYLASLSEDSCGISDNRNLLHFSCIAGNSILQVITAEEPVIEFIK